MLIKSQLDIVSSMGGRDLYMWLSETACIETVALERLLENKHTWVHDVLGRVRGLSQEQYLRLVESSRLGAESVLGNPEAGQARWRAYEKVLEGGRGSLLWTLVSATWGHNLEEEMLLEMSEKFLEMGAHGSEVSEAFFENVFEHDLSEEAFKQLSKTALELRVARIVILKSRALPLSLQEEMAKRGYASKSLLARNRYLDMKVRKTLLRELNPQHWGFLWRGRVDDELFTLLKEKLEYVESGHFNGIRLNSDQLNELLEMDLNWDVAGDDLTISMLTPEPEVLKKLLDGRAGYDARVNALTEVRDEGQRLFELRRSKGGDEIEALAHRGLSVEEIKILETQVSEWELGVLLMSAVNYNEELKVGTLLKAAEKASGGVAKLLLARARTLVKTDTFDVLVKEWQGSLEELVQACRELEN